MSAILRIAAEEWRLWLRSRLALAGLVVFALLLGSTGWLTKGRMDEERAQRLQHQTAAEETFRAQPDRHPHRMVHYGHYVFRVPPPLAAFDPGVDAVTGQSMFLEGHRQNSDLFADARGAANTGGFGRLTPALVYQVFLPLLLVVLGHAAMLRERESGTLAALLAQGLAGPQVFLGKLLALAGVAAGMMAPAALLAAWAVSQGEAASVVLALLALYFAYLLLWALLVLLASTVAMQRGAALGALVLVWLCWSLLLPRLGVAFAGTSVPALGKLEVELQMLAEKRNLADGHNASDPAFEALRNSLMAEYGVDRLEDLPVNFRGLVSAQAETALTRTLNEYAERKMALEVRQANRLAGFSWLSPTLGLGLASRSLAGTDLATHHRFLREAEALRYEFVQRLNALHAHELRYVDDIRRSSDPEAERRTRVSAANWSLLEAFRFQPAQAAERLGPVLPQFGVLGFWLALVFAAGLLTARRLKP